MLTCPIIPAHRSTCASPPHPQVWSAHNLAPPPRPPSCGRWWPWVVMSATACATEWAAACRSHWGTRTVTNSVRMAVVPRPSIGYGRPIGSTGATALWCSIAGIQPTRQDLVGGHTTCARMIRAVWSWVKLVCVLTNATRAQHSDSLLFNRRYVVDLFVEYKWVSRWATTHRR